MAVDLGDPPPERLPLVHERLYGHDVVRGAVERPLVVVDDGDEVVQLVLVGEHRRLPHLTLMQLSVAQDAVRPIGGVDALDVARQEGLLCSGRSQDHLQLLGVGHAGGEGESLPERTTRIVDARGGPPVGVALEGRTVAVVGAQGLLREDPQLDQSRIDSLAAVSLGHDHPVALGPIRVLGVELDVVQVERRHHIDDGHSAPSVPLLEGAELGEAVVAQLVRLGFERGHEGVVMRHASPSP